MNGAITVDTIKAAVRRGLPPPVRRAVATLKARLLRVRQAPLNLSGLLREPPWTSPNIWREITEHLNTRHEPTVVEYGCGASTLHHVRRLMSQGGVHVSVESDPEWFALVLSGLVSEALARRWEVRISSEQSLGDGALDVSLRLSSSTGVAALCLLRLRPERPKDSVWEADYVGAFSAPADAVIVDGRCRKACVDFALDSALLKPGGMLALFEAGRGLPFWLGRPTLTGELDYQPQVQRMLRLGGRMVDGVGVDRWPELTQRRTPGREATQYQREACLLIMPAVRE